VSEQQFFDTELYSITEFKDFDENVWREAWDLIDCHKEDIIKHRRVEKMKAEPGNKRKHHSIN
jgi:hypothetical protein